MGADKDCVAETEGVAFEEMLSSSSRPAAAAAASNNFFSSSDIPFLLLLGAGVVRADAEEDDRPIRWPVKDEMRVSGRRKSKFTEGN